MKNAVVDQILLWMVLFVIFVGFLFFIIDYSNAIKVKDNADALADYSARMVSLGKSDSDITTGLNNIKGDFVATIAPNSLTCIEDTSVSNYQVIVHIYATLTNSFLPVSSNNIHAKTVVFNEDNEFKQECSLTLTLN